MTQLPAASDPFEERAADTATAEALAQRALQAARRAGADAAAVHVSLSRALTVSVRQAEVESLEFQRDRDLALEVYCGQRSGSASTADWSDEGLARAADAAVAIARASGEDPCAGLPDAADLAQDIPELDLFHPWVEDADRAIDIARDCEAAALAVDACIRQSEGASLDTARGVSLLANSLGFCAHHASSRHSLSCAVIAKDGDDMQRDHWYTAARVPSELLSAEAVGRRAGERAKARLGAGKIATRQCPVLFPPELARGLWGALANAASGPALYRRASFLLDRAGSRIAAPGLRLQEHPRQPRASGSAAFDGEGVATRDNVLLDDGVLQQYLLGSYSARRLGLRTTGNAGGVHNLRAEPTTDNDCAALARDAGDGLLVTELMGQGTNPVTGDYSRGAAGFVIRGGELAEPVDEITIAGNLLDMLADVQAVGSDVDDTGSIHSGSVLIGRMTVAGS